MDKIDYNIVAMAAMLKNWRMKCGLTVYRISQETGIAQHTLARIESGDNVHSSALLQYLDFVRQADAEWDIIKEWEKTKKWLKRQHKG